MSLRQLQMFFSLSGIQCLQAVWCLSVCSLNRTVIFIYINFRAKTQHRLLSTTNKTQQFVYNAAFNLWE